jgi:DNA-binding CsgD family transcriptional regulator
MRIKAAGRLARASAWLALFAGILVIYLSFVLFDFFPPSAVGAQVQIYLLNFAGMVLGAALCPLFLPLPLSPSGEIFLLAKEPWISAAFIVLVITPNLVVRSLGVAFWLGSIPARIFMALSSGMMQPIALGLFYVTRLQASSPSRPPYANRTGPYASLLLAAAMMTAVVVRQGAMPLLEHSGLAAEPMRAMTLLFNILKWTALCLGLSAVVCVLALGKGRSVASNGRKGENPPTDWKMIARLLGLGATFFILNSLLEMRLFPLVSGAEGAYRPYFPAVIPATLLLAFLAGRSALFVAGKTGPFLRRLLIPMMLLFILLPALHFLNDAYPAFALAMNTLVSIAHFSIWSIFTTAMVELCRGRKFFYVSAAAVYMIYSLAFLGPLLGPLIPRGPGYMVLISAVGALVFTLLGFRALFPGLPLLAETGPEPPAHSVSALFRDHGLTEREAEVARLIVMEGLSNQQIAERIFRSKFTVEKHVTGIYRKFGVSDRAAFVAKALRQGHYPIGQTPGLFTTRR